LKARWSRHWPNTSWRELAGAGLLATIAMTGCSASPVSSPGAAGNGQPSSSPAVTTPGNQSAGGQSVAPTPAVSATPVESDGIQHLLVSSAVRSQLTAAYVALRQIPASDVSGTYPGSVYYAYDPATNTYWAKAGFVPSKTAPQSLLEIFQQDGSGAAFYRKVGSGPWQARYAGDGPCIYVSFFPKAVLAAWAIPMSVPAGVSCDQLAEVGRL